METFFDRFSIVVHPSGLNALHDYQRVFRFGATPLVLCTLLTVLGLVLGPRRARVAVLMFGVGALTMLLPPALLGTYVARYTVPIAPVPGCRSRDRGTDALAERGASAAVGLRLSVSQHRTR